MPVLPVQGPAKLMLADTREAPLEVEMVAATPLETGAASFARQQSSSVGIGGRSAHPAGVTDVGAPALCPRLR